MVNLIGINTEYKHEVDGLIQKQTQEIPPEFLNDLEEFRYESTKQREGEFMRVASIPTSVVTEWKREGFNAYEAPHREILRRLRNRGLEHFIATEKRV